jgi:zinc transport system ATP-binding protein
MNSEMSQVQVDTPLVTLKQISVSFDDRLVLKNVDLQIAPREIISLIGPNGAGKSTLVKVVLGLQKPDQGTRAVRADVVAAYVPQRVHLSPSLPMRVVDLLALEQATAEHRAKIMDETGIVHIGQRAMQQLSGGERQRVLLARALLRKPTLLVLDEPMQGLDPQSEIQLNAYVRSLPERYGCAVLIISHDLQWVMQGTQRVICLNHHICCSGSPEHVQRAPEYQALFGTGRVWYEHRHEHCAHTDLHDAPLIEQPARIHPPLEIEP